MQNQEKIIVKNKSNDNIQNNKNLLFKMIYCATFMALIFVSTYIKIDFPIGGMIHLGNFVAILASLLFGGGIGSIAGSVGMGLFDLINGYGITTVLRTFIVKFIFLFIIGYLFRILLKSNKKHKILPLIISLIFIILGTITLTIYLALYKNENLFLISAIFLYIFALLFFIVYFIYYKANKILKFAIMSSSVGIICNIILEFVFRIVLLLLLDPSNYDFNDAYILAITKTPSAIINGALTLVLVFICFMPLYMITNKINRLNDLPKQ